MKKIALMQLKNFGLKETPIRLSILTFLYQENRPVDVGEIITFLRQLTGSADKVTVYRTLDLFCAKGVVNRLELQERKFRYEVQQTDHHHFICEQCGEITELSGCPIQDVEIELEQKQKVVIKRHALEFFGICQHCQ